MSKTLTLERLLTLKLRGESLTFNEFHAIRNVARRVLGHWVPFAFTEEGLLVEMKCVKDDFTYRLIEVVRGELPEKQPSPEKWGLWNPKDKRWFLDPRKNPPEELKFISGEEALAWRDSFPEVKEVAVPRIFPSEVETLPHEKWGLWSTALQDWLLLPYLNVSHPRIFCSSQEAQAWADRQLGLSEYFPKVFKEVGEGTPKAVTVETPPPEHEEWGICFHKTDTFLSRDPKDPQELLRFSSRKLAMKYLDKNASAPAPDTGCYVRRIKPPSPPEIGKFGLWNQDKGAWEVVSRDGNPEILRFMWQEEALRYMSEHLEVGSCAVRRIS